MHHDASMSKPKSSVKTTPENATRITVAFPEAHYAHVLRLAKSKKVSASSVVRDAVEKYVTADIPLFAQLEGKGR